MAENAYIQSFKKRSEEQRKLEEHATQSQKQMKEKKSSNRTIISISLSPEDKELLQQYAKKEGYSVSAIIHKLIRENIDL